MILLRNLLESEMMRDDLRFIFFLGCAYCHVRRTAPTCGGRAASTSRLENAWWNPAWCLSRFCFLQRCQSVRHRISRFASLTYVTGVPSQTKQSRFSIGRLREDYWTSRLSQSRRMRTEAQPLSCPAPHPRKFP